MSKKVFKTTLDPKELSRVIRELTEYKAWFTRKTKELTEALANLGTEVAREGFAGAQYDGTNDVSVMVRPLESGNGWAIVASGQAVAFIEFSAGVYYNPTDPYPLPRPPGIVGIGEYGKGQGKKQGWVYFNGEEKVFTHGNPAAMPLWYATEEIRRRVIQVAREVFAS